MSIEPEEVMSQQAVLFRNEGQVELKPEQKYLLRQRSFMLRQRSFMLRKTSALSQHKELKIAKKYVVTKYNYVAIEEF